MRSPAHASSCPRDRAAATLSSRPSNPLDRTGLLFLQRSAGNAAVAALLGGRRSAAASVVQRQPQADPPALTSPLLAGSPRLQLAYHNKPTVKHHEKGDGVKALQLALVQVGFGNLLTRTMKGGTPDGDYGDETLTAVRAFQTKHGVRPIGGPEAGENPPRGWFANGAVELDIHPFRSGILKPLEIDTQVNGGGLIIPQPAPDHDFRTGTFGFQTVLKYQF